MNAAGFNHLRSLARRQPAASHCDLCGLAIATEHEHFIDARTRKLLCACDSCTMLFPQESLSKFKRVGKRRLWIEDFHLTDEQWDSLAIPIGLAFFLKSSVDNRVLAFYPSPAGPMESLLSLGAWGDIAAENPILHEMLPDIEALLVNRVVHGHGFFLAPIDKCYELVGLIRTHWRGLSGGTEVWAEAGRFFDDLKQSAVTERVPCPI